MTRRFNTGRLILVNTLRHFAVVDEQTVKHVKKKT